MPTSPGEVGGRIATAWAGACVFGVNDGLVSNAALLLGVAGAAGAVSYLAGRLLGAATG